MGGIETTDPVDTYHETLDNPDDVDLSMRLTFYRTLACAV